MPIQNGSGLNSVAAPQQTTLVTNYIDFTAAGTAGWAQQYLPDLLEGEAEVFGSRTIAGFLSQVGAEEAMSSDQVIWSEQGRLHLSYTGTISDVTGHGGTNSAPSQITLSKDIDGNTVANDGHGVRVNDLLLVATASGTARCIVHAVDAGATTIEVSAFGLADLASLGADGVACTIMVFGSEFSKGSTGRTVANSPAFQTFNNKPIILKD